MELRDLYDENKELTGETIYKGQDVPKGRYYITVVVFIQNSKNEFLIQKRVKKKDGKWATTGGHPVSGETSKQGIITEIKEELGVEIKEEELKFIAIVKSTKNPKNCEFGYVYLVECNNQIEEYVFEDNEVSEVKYVYFEDLEKMVVDRAEGLLIHEEEYNKLFAYIRENY